MNQLDRATATCDLSNAALPSGASLSRSFLGVKI
jgi:hypothetical protein